MAFKGFKRGEEEGGEAPPAQQAPPQPVGPRFQPDHMLPEADRGKAILYRMLLIRRFEERAGEMYSRAKIGGFLHLCIGEEAAVVGTSAAMRTSDYLISTYREHGQVLARGTPANEVMAELFGRETGVSKGRGGSMHMFDIERRFMGGYGIVGGNLPIAAGLGLASVYRGTDDAVVCMLGDGATNQGTFGETLNLAALWKLPVVFIIVNNQFGMGTALDRHSAITDLSAKGEGFGVPGTRCDGMDVLDVESCVKNALELVRTERHPVLIEALTYRFRGHSIADPEEYRTKEEVDEWRARDPIMQFANKLIKGGAMTGAEAEELDKLALAEVDEAVTFADQSPFPALDSLYDNVYVLGDQLRGWYSVDTRKPGSQRGEDIAGDDELQRLAEAGAAYHEGSEFDEQIVMREGVPRDDIGEPDLLPPLNVPAEQAAPQQPAPQQPAPQQPTPQQPMPQQPAPQQPAPQPPQQQPIPQQQPPQPLPVDPQPVEPAPTQSPPPLPMPPLETPRDNPPGQSPPPLPLPLPPEDS